MAVFVRLTVIPIDPAMTAPSATRVTAARSCALPARSFTDEEAAHLREILQRCSPATFQAACQFKQTGNPQFLPALISGIIERFVESDLRPKLQPPDAALRLSEDLGLDSLTLMEIVILVEDVLAISIHNEELRPLRTLGDVEQFIEGKLRD